MAVQGIGQYTSYTSVYRNNQISESDAPVNGVNAQPEVAANTAGQGNGDNQNAQTDFTIQNRAPRVSNPSDFSLIFKKNNDYNLVAATSDAEDINVNKALDDMQKDSVLEQYKFFVSTANLGTDADGTVRLK